MIAHDSTDLQSVGTKPEIGDEKQPFEGSCAQCDGDRFPCFKCVRSGRRGLPRYRRLRE